MAKLTGLSRLNIAAIEGIYHDVPLVRSGKTFVELPESAIEARRRVGLAMSTMPDRRHHPYASLHAVMRKLDALATEEASGATDAQGGPEAPAEAPVVTESQEEATTMPAREYVVAEDGSLVLANVDEVPATDSIPEDHPIKVKLDAEIAEVQRQWQSIEDAHAGLQAEYDKAWAKERSYEDRTVPEKVKAAADAVSEKILRALNQQKALRQQLDRLSSPAELLRRMQDANATTERIGKLMATKTTKPAKPTAKSQGFPSVYLGKDSDNFYPGGDAAAKSDLIACAMGGKGKKHTFTPEEAKKLIKARGWESFLNRKIEIEAKKAADKSAKAVVKSSAKSGSTAKASAGEGEVTPDPKPARKPRTGGRKVGK